MTETPTQPHQIGPRSRRFRLLKLDRRTREGKYLADCERALVQHLGGLAAITTPQLFLIQQVATDMLRLAQLDERITKGDASDHSFRVASALRNSVRLGLHALGLQRPVQEPRVPTLAEVLANHEADTP